MRVVVRDISVKGRNIRFSGTDSWAADAVAKAVEGTLVSLDGVLELRRNHVDATVTVRGKTSVRCCCARCGKDVPIDLDVDEKLLYKPLSDSPGTGEIELSADELDVGWYEGDELPLQQVLAEAFVLELPPRIMCAEDGCEAVPVGDTDQDEPTGHPAFAALKDLF